MTSIEAIEDEFGLLEDISSNILEIETENTEYMADIEELEAKRAILKKQVQDIEKERLKAEEDEIDEIKDTLEEINDELEGINEKIDSDKEEIEELKEKLQFLLDKANIDIGYITIEDESIFEEIRSEIELKLQTLDKRLSELRKQESQQEFDSNLSLNSLLSNLLLEVKAQLPDPGIFGISFENWWLEKGPDWAEKLRNLVCKLIIDFRNLGYDWQFNNQQMKLLNQYYDGNKLLVDCLNSDCYMSRPIREKVEGTLLLPIAEIEQSHSYRKV
ncbi:hypothetical protein [Nostoc sp. GT001]|uniref:NACHT C-terminal helical domain 2-containing protein n=1 Tax=Nostoc sp. GT001 TaxID=3056647 RepID=UPI0025AB085B|nr:hypothetical protein [Nostoc sp. GT001]MDM9584942.1 hypothetical protein [Nostoc sp. GT001]